MSEGDRNIQLRGVSMIGSVSIIVPTAKLSFVEERATVEIKKGPRYQRFLASLQNLFHSIVQPVENKITRPPGAFLDHLAEFFCTKQTYAGVLRPAIVDMQFEYFEALAADRKWKSRWIRARGYWHFWRTWAWSSIVKIALGIWKLFGDH